MTSRELTSGSDLWSRVHLRMAVMHLHIKFSADIFIQSGVIDIFPKFKMAAAAILDFYFIWIWPFRRAGSVVFINFRFQLLVTWSSVHGFVASSHEIWCRYLYQSGVIDIFPKLKMAVAAILELLGWAIAPPTKPHSWCVPPVKISSWSAK